MPDGTHDPPSEQGKPFMQTDEAVMAMFDLSLL
jgi:hypothetical protein